MANTPFRILTPGALQDAKSVTDPLVASAVDAGRRPPAARVEELAGGTRPVLVHCAPEDGGGQDPAGPAHAPPPIAGTVPVDAAEEVALASIYAWAGARVIVTEHPERVRRALDMVASIRGERPPAAVRRGLA